MVAAAEAAEAALVGAAVEEEVSYNHLIKLRIEKLPFSIVFLSIKIQAAVEEAVEEAALDGAAMAEEVITRSMLTLILSAMHRSDRLKVPKCLSIPC